MYIGITKLSVIRKAYRVGEKSKKRYYEKFKKTFKKRIENSSGRYPNVSCRILLVFIGKKMYSGRITLRTYYRLIN